MVVDNEKKKCLMRVDVLSGKTHMSVVKKKNFDRPPIFILINRPYRRRRCLLATIEGSAWVFLGPETCTAVLPV